jgi:hypothetical protein
VQVASRFAIQPSRELRDGIAVRWKTGSTGGRRDQAAALDVALRAEAATEFGAVTS